MSLLVTVLALSGCGGGTINISPPAEGSNIISPFAVEIRWTGDVNGLDSIRLDDTDVQPQFVFDYGNKIAKATLNANPGLHNIEASGQIPPMIYGRYGGSRLYSHVTFTVGTCPSGQQNCGGVCRNLQTDSQTCGSCNNACGSGKICVQGTCQCPTRQRLCSGQCVNFSCPDARYGHACGGVCAECSGKPFGSNSKDECILKTGTECPPGYSPTLGVCVKCGNGPTGTWVPPPC
jgi:hypothetical protein